MSDQRFIQEMQHTLAENLGKIEACLKLLTDEQFWWRPNARSNSVGNQILHICGNLSLWILAGLGGEPYERHRSREFTAGFEAGSRQELGRRISDIIQRCSAVAAKLTGEQLRAPRHIQGMDTDGLGAVHHAVDHVTYHTAQIVFITKQLVDESVEIEFYPQHRNE